LGKITEILNKKLPGKLKLATPTLYQGYKEYIKDFILKGGIVEAAPTCAPSKIRSPSIFF
jgi:hypothetical protein